MRRATILLWFAGLAACAWVSLARTTFTADLTAFLPDSVTPAQQLLMTQLRDGVASRLIIVALEGAEPEALAATSKALARALAASGEFAYVANGEEALAREDREFLFAHRYLLSPAVTRERFSVAGLREALDETVETLASPLGALIRPTIARDPTGEFGRVLGPLADRSRPPTRHGVWVTADGKRALLMAETKVSGFDPVPQERAQGLLASAFESARAAPTMRLITTGPAVFALQSRNAIEHDAWFLALVATVLVIVILALAYRAPVLVAFAFVPVVSGALAGVAVVSLTFGTVHGITLGFGATLIGEAVDYPTFLFTQRASGEPAGAAMRRIWPTLRLAVLTTVFGSIALMFSSFVGLAQLGLFSLVGVLVAGLVTRYVIPEIVPQRFAGAGSLPAPAIFARIVDAARPLRWLVVLVLALSIGWLLAKRESIWESDITMLNPIPEHLKALDGELRSALGAPDVRVMLAVSAADESAALEKCEALAPVLRSLIEERLIERYDSPADILPSARTQAERRAALPARAELATRLAEAARDSPLRADQFEPFLDDVERARNAATIDSRAMQNTVWGLAMRSHLVAQNSRVVALLPVHGVVDPRALARRIAAIGDPSLYAFNLHVESNAMVEAYRNESLVLAGVGVLAIALVLVAGLREVRGVAAVLTPVLAAMFAVAALLVAFGVRLTVFHLVSLLLVLGVGVNYALFFNRQWREDDEHLRTTFSVLVANLTTVCAFGALALSDTPILSSIGITVGVGAVLSLVFSAAWARARV